MIDLHTFSVNFHTYPSLSSLIICDRVSVTVVTLWLWHLYLLVKSWTPNKESLSWRIFKHWSRKTDQGAGVIASTQDQGLAEVKSVAMDTNFGLQEVEGQTKAVKLSYWVFLHRCSYIQEMMLLDRQQLFILIGLLLLSLPHRTCYKKIIYHGIKTFFLSFLKFHYTDGLEILCPCFNLDQ